VGWLTPELVRVKGELFLLQSAPTAVETAEDLFRQALDGARRQQALSWELGVATSLARLLRMGATCPSRWQSWSRSMTGLPKGSGPRI
jgi:hypothetical protein